MNKHLVTALASSALILGLAACGPTSKAPGTYETESSSVDSNGTRTTKKSYTDVSVDGAGHKKVVSKTKTTKDPKGLFNKTTTSKTDVEVESR